MRTDYRNFSLRTTFALVVAAVFTTVGVSQTVEDVVVDDGGPIYFDSVFPQWEAGAGPVFMQRSSPDSSVVLINNANNPLFNANQFEFDWETGIWVSLQRNNGDGTAWQAIYFGVDDWADAASVLSGSGAHVNSNPRVGITISNVDVSYSSELDSFEFNLRQEGGNVDIVLGIRWIGLDEEIEAELTGGPDDGEYYSYTDNNLFGIQTGVEALLVQNGGLTIEGVLKGGLFYNDAEHRFYYVGGAGPTMVDDTTDEGEMSFVLDASLLATLQLNANTAIEAGYQVLWIQNVAEAGSQAEATFGNAGVWTGIDTNNDVFYQAGTIRLVIYR